ncbi:hypothetical protein L873DRAFT_1814194 [Choiromyces venosus 120613-1]|uniref:Aminoglycoside phosphotransferase domain-containing protein n=1 Tax=Choiromyces venosus 120613-1 TaxID=1336337 RepID=A0A3N4JL69_9PEZI|nr:hypothetical protein L873DRAFT_1814194 [Choiromyces venosus 120613-1]
MSYFDQSIKPTPERKPSSLAIMVANELNRISQNESIIEFQERQGQQLPGGAGSNTYVLRFPIAPYYDARYVLKSHDDVETRDPEGRTRTEACGMEHARRAFARYMPGCRLVPETYWTDFENGALAMEFVPGVSLGWQVMGGWSAEQDRQFIRRLAAVRLVLLAQTAPRIGAPVVLEDGGLGVGPKSGEIYFGQERGRYYDHYQRGPFRYASQSALAGLRNEIEFFERHHAANLFPQTPAGKEIGFGNFRFPETWHDWINYLQSLLPHFPDGRGHNEAEEPIYHLTHFDLSTANNILAIGSTIIAVIDWETAEYAPFSESVNDIPFVEGPNCCFNHMDWERYVAETRDEQYFLTMLNPYDESLWDRLGTYSQGLRPRYPLYRKIERCGGPLQPEDFEPPSLDMDEDMDVDMDGDRAYGHSDDELDDQDDPLPRLGDKDLEFYILPMWALMREYISRAVSEQRDEGMLHFPEAIAHPLASWRDPALRILTSQQLTTDMPDRLVPRGEEGPPAQQEESD